MLQMLFQAIAALHTFADRGNGCLVNQVGARHVGLVCMKSRVKRENAEFGKFGLAGRFEGEGKKDVRVMVWKGAKLERGTSSLLSWYGGWMGGVMRDGRAGDAQLDGWLGVTAS